MDCGPACLRMVAKYYGRTYTLQTLRQRCFITREGVSMLGISDAAEGIGFRTTGVKINFEQLCNDVSLPSIAHWSQNHFVVVYRVKKHKGGKTIVYAADPAHGLIQYNEKEFIRCWGVTKVEGKDCGTLLTLQPGPEFYDMED
ncbi:MAG: cysteine peptidase family C39 domain-containing protein, partial [Bacteroidales bacterium]|nr:cysteine peptidase family C39 domain-containing protein [Bacteroidales bacterium]